MINLHHTCRDSFEQVTIEALRHQPLKMINKFRRVYFNKLNSIDRTLSEYANFIVTHCQNSRQGRNQKM